MSCVIFDSWVWSLSETVNTTRLDLIYEGARGLTSGLSGLSGLLNSLSVVSRPR